MTDKTQQQQAENRFIYYVDLLALVLNIAAASGHLVLYKLGYPGQEVAMQFHLALAIILRLPPRSIND